MIKFALAAVWIAAATVASVYFSFNMAREKQATAPAPSLFGGLDYLNTEIMSVPIFRDGEVLGYFLGRIVYTVEPAEVKKLVIPPAALITDQVYSYLYANPQIDFSARDKIDVEALRAGIKESVNKRVGRALVHDVMIEQMDFLTKEDVRDNTVRRRAATTEHILKRANANEGEAQPPADTAPTPSH